MILDRLKVCHITPHTGGGVGTVLKAIILQSRGVSSCEHTIITLEESNDITRIWCQEHGVTLCENGMDRFLLMTQLIEMADLVQIHFWNHPLLTKFLFGITLPPMRTVLWSHVNGHTPPQAFYPELIQWADLFVVATPFSFEAEVLKNGAYSHIHYIQSCAGIPSYAPMIYEKPEECLFGYVGTVDYCKMDRRIFSIWKKADIPNATLHFYGGPSHDTIAKNIPFECSVEFHGVVSPIDSVFQDLSVLVYPLQKDHYGTGEQVLIEALACGVVPVVFGNGCEQYIVEDGVTGFVVNTADEFSTILRRLANDRELRQTIAIQGMASAQKRFPIETTIDQWHDLYYSIMQKPLRDHSVGVNDFLDEGKVFFSLAYGGTEMGREILSSFSSEEKMSVTIQLPEAMYSQTRGTPRHYLRYYPRSPFLQRAVEQLRASDKTVDLEHCESTASYRLCPLCGSKAISQRVPLSYALFDDTEASGISPLVNCAHCGVTYNDCDITEVVLDHYYRQNAYYADSIGGGSGGLSGADIWRYESIWEKILPLLPEAPVVVDMGCGKGGFLQFLHERGVPRCYGVEKSNACRDPLFNNGNVYSSTEELPLDHADCIVLSHILEHLFNPSGVIDSIARLCNEETLLYCEVPNGSYYLEEECRWEHCYFEHLTHFTLPSLCHFWESYGFTVCQSGLRPFSVSDSAVNSIYVLLKKKQSLLPAQGRVLPLSLSPFRLSKSTETVLRKAIDRHESWAIWGMSQYCMLVLGMVPELSNRAVLLCDSSPAKIGRTIRGIPIVPVEQLFESIDQLDHIFIPRSPYTNEMMERIVMVSQRIKVSIL